MALKALKCPGCGANLELDDSREIGFCEYCGAKVQIREIIEVRVKADNSEQLSNYKMLGNRAYDVKNYSEALKYYSKAIEISPNDSECLYRKAFSRAYENISSKLNVSEFSNDIKNAIKYGTESEKDEIEKELVNLFNLHLKNSNINQTVFSGPSSCDNHVKDIKSLISVTKSIVPLLNDDKDKELVLHDTIEFCDRKTYNKMYYEKIGPKGNKVRTNYRPSPSDISHIEKARDDFSEIYFKLPQIVGAQEYLGKLSADIAELKIKIKEQKKIKDKAIKNPQRKGLVSGILEIIIGSILLILHGVFWGFVVSSTTYEDGTKASFGVNMLTWLCLFIPAVIVIIPLVMYFISNRRKKYFVNQPLIEEKCNADKVYNLNIQYYTKKNELNKVNKELTKMKKQNK